jgi:uncharacterized Zn-binding protein involved in type VI secretion
MPALARHGDTNEEGGAIISGASTVMVNGQLVAQVGNLIEPHAPWDPNEHPPHESATVTSGSTSVFADGIAVAFVGSGNSCGHSIETGSTDVIVG